MKSYNNPRTSLSGSLMRPSCANDALPCGRVAPDTSAGAPAWCCSAVSLRFFAPMLTGVSRASSKVLGQMVVSALECQRG